MQPQQFELFQILFLDFTILNLVITMCKKNYVIDKASPAVVKLILRRAIAHDSGKNQWKGGCIGNELSKRNRQWSSQNT